MQDKQRNIEVRQISLSLLTDWEKNNRTGTILPVFYRTLKDKGDPLRKEVIQGLLIIGKNKDVPYLLEVFKDKNETIETRKIALSVLINLAPEKTLSEIKKHLIFKT
jgi:hypothetical protein